MASKLPQPGEIQALLGWIAAWSAAGESYFEWIKDEYQARLKRFEDDRRAARDRLLKSAMNDLELDQGRLDPKRFGHGAKKRRFRAHTDKILDALALRGQQRFAIRGRRTRVGIFKGQVTPGLKRRAVARIRQALREASREAKRAVRSAR